MNDLQRNNSQKVQQATALYAGPIPPPEALARYEQLTPGLADRIVKMAENEGNHRRALETNGQKAQIEHLKRRDCEAKLGQIFAFLITTIFIGAGTYVIISGHSVAGTFISFAGISSIVTAFIYGRKNQVS